MLYNPKAFITHAASLRHAFAHCGRFSTAASRRSLGSVSVPMWPITLSGRLPIVALVSHYLTNKLIGHRPLPERKLNQRPPLINVPADTRPYWVLAPVSRCCPHLEGRLSMHYSPVRHFTHTRRCFLVRLACLIHAANVRSEPGSNPSLDILATRTVRSSARPPAEAGERRSLTPPTVRAGIVKLNCVLSAHRRNGARTLTPQSRRNPNFQRAVSEADRLGTLTVCRGRRNSGAPYGALAVCSPQRRGPVIAMPKIFARGL